LKLDADGRFELTPSPPGFKLSIDGANVVYCRDVGAVCAYVSEHLIGSVDTGLRDGLRKISDDVRAARSTAQAIDDLILIHRALVRAEKGGGDRRQRVMAVALEISGCRDVDVFRSHDKAKEIATLAKAIVETWGGCFDGREEKGSGDSSTQKLDQDL